MLAGGASRRFGRDKLAEPVGGRPLLDHTLGGLVAVGVTRIVLVGPPRTVGVEPVLSDGRGADPARVDSARVSTVWEEPPGGGPTAGMVAGLAWVLEWAAEDVRIVTVPGDAVHGGQAVAPLLAALDHADIAVGVDPQGVDQVLQLGLTRGGASRLVQAAGPSRGHGASARRLLAALDPGVFHVPLPARACLDIDHTEDMPRVLS